MRDRAESLIQRPRVIQLASAAKPDVQSIFQLADKS